VAVRSCFSWCAAAFIFAWSSLAYAVEPLPEGNAGIAAAYNGDAGIGNDPQVIFADDFESYGSPDELWSGWDNVYQLENIAIVAGEEGFDGSQSVRLTMPTGESEVSNELLKNVEPAVDVLFLRYYAKYDPALDIVGSSHNGSTMSASYWDGPGSGPGIPADGANKFLVNLEAGRIEDSDPSPGWLNVYIYHPDQRDMWGDIFYPTGIVSPFTSTPFDFGPEFVPRDDVVPEVGVWNSYEIMVRANTPGERDGRIAAWLDGVLVADWHNLRLRDVAELQMDLFGVGFHARANPNAECHKWYDHVVAATAYIGPIATEPGGGDSGGDSSGGDTGEGGSGATTGGGPSGDGSNDDDPSGTGSAAGGTSGSDGGDAGGAGDEEAASAGCRTGSSGAATPCLLLLLLLRPELRRRCGGQ